MTGFGRAEVRGDAVVVSVETRSVNHRHLDVAIRLPRALAALELDARRLVASRLDRGRVDVSVQVSTAEYLRLGVLASVGHRRAYPNAFFAMSEPKVSFDGPATAVAVHEEQIRQTFGPDLRQSAPQADDCVGGERLDIADD